MPLPMQSGGRGDVSGELTAHTAHHKILHKINESQFCFRRASPPTYIVESIVVFDINILRSRRLTCVGRSVGRSVGRVRISCPWFACSLTPMLRCGLSKRSFYLNVHEFKRLRRKTLETYLQTENRDLNLTDGRSGTFNILSQPMEQNEFNSEAKLTLWLNGCCSLLVLAPSVFFFSFTLSFDG